MAEGSGAPESSSSSEQRWDEEGAMVIWTSELFLLWHLSFTYGKGSAMMRRLGVFCVVGGWEVFDERAQRASQMMIKLAWTYNIL